MKSSLIAILLFASSALAAAPALNCNIGPAHKTFGGSTWLVYGCSDKHSVVVVTASGSSAAPFVFIFAYNEGRYNLHGEGNGNKSATDAAFNELSRFSSSQIAGLFSDASKVSK